jgi:AcrR family transcriptional regulator
MSPLSKQQLEQIREERIEQIKKAAIKTFAQHGYEGTKMSLIAEEAGLSQGLFYRYFKSKDELFTMLIKELLETANMELQGINHLPGTPREQIRTLTEHIFDESNKYSFMFIQHARTMKKIPDKANEILERHSPNELIDLLVPIFIKGQEMGEFREGDPRQLLSWYFHIVNCLITSDNGYHEYGLPDVDTIMRILA